MATKKSAAQKIAADPAALQENVVEAPKAEAPKPKYAETDNSIDARMWRLEQDHKAMGSR